MKNALTKLNRMLSSVHPLILTLSTLSIVGMNLLANKSIDTGTSWLALDCGILLSWLAFLSMDVATHCYGPRTATAVSLTALALNLVMVAVFYVASIIPGVWGESFVPGSEATINVALDHTFGGTWFIILGSSIAYAISAVINNFLNWGIGEQVGDNKSFGTFALRSYISTFVAQFTDNITFALIVSRTFFGWTMLQCVTCALAGAILELLFEVFFSPIGYRISRKLLSGGSSAKALDLT
ncbi:MAG: VUT family protein [Atopobiaceae bacterium]|nr:VUT family protein [Atopobiaceae bacterium]